MLAFERWSGWEHLVVVMNLTPVPWTSWRVGVPRAGRYVACLDTDAASFGGSGFQLAESFETEPVAWHGREQSIVLDLPPLALLVLELKA